MLAAAVSHCNKPEMDRIARYLGDICHLFPAGTEGQLLKMLASHAIQVIIIDAEPGNPQDGIRLCSRLKSTPHIAHLPVILLIAPGNQPARIGCLESGADAWMEKPLSRDYLRAQISNLLANRGRLKSYFSQALLLNRDPAVCTGENDAFLSRLNSFIFEHLPDIDLNVEVLAQQMNVSRPTLYRKVKCISDRTPNDLVKTIRLNKAAELLSTGDDSVLEIARSVGFHSRSNFGKAFAEHFHVTPKHYRQMTKSREIHVSMHPNA